MNLVCLSLSSISRTKYTLTLVLQRILIVGPTSLVLISNLGLITVYLTSFCVLIQINVIFFLPKTLGEDSKSLDSVKKKIDQYLEGEFDS